VEFRLRWYKRDARRGIASVVDIRKALPESIRRCIAFGTQIREGHNKSLRYRPGSAIKKTWMTTWRRMS
jgi:hypothetical protein